MTGYITKGIGGFYYVKTSEGIVECKPRGIFRKQKITPVAGDVGRRWRPRTAGGHRGHRAPGGTSSSARPWRTIDVLLPRGKHHPAHPQQPSCWISSRPSRWTRASSPSSSAPKATSPRRSSCAAPTKDRPCPSSASTTPPARASTTSNTGSMAVSAPSAATPAWAKSTLLNALLPDVERQTAAISQKLGRGRHTTREVTIFEAFGGRIADTPGFASLEASRAGFIPKEKSGTRLPGVRALPRRVPVHRLLPPLREGLRRPRRPCGRQALPDTLRQLLRHVR